MRQKITELQALNKGLHEAMAGEARAQCLGVVLVISRATNCEAGRSTSQAWWPHLGPPKGPRCIQTNEQPMANLTQPRHPFPSKTPSCPTGKDKELDSAVARLGSQLEMLETAFVRRDIEIKRAQELDSVVVGAACACIVAGVHIGAEPYQTWCRMHPAAPHLLPASCMRPLLHIPTL